MTCPRCGRNVWSSEEEFHQHDCFDPFGPFDPIHAEMVKKHLQQVYERLISEQQRCGAITLAQAVELLKREPTPEQLRQVIEEIALPYRSRQAEAEALLADLHAANITARQQAEAEALPPKKEKEPPMLIDGKRKIKPQED